MSNRSNCPIYLITFFNLFNSRASSSKAFFELLHWKKILNVINAILCEMILRSSLKKLWRGCPWKICLYLPLNLSSYGFCCLNTKINDTHNKVNYIYWILSNKIQSIHKFTSKNVSLFSANVYQIKLTIFYVLFIILLARVNDHIHKMFSLIKFINSWRHRFAHKHNN